MHLQDLNLKNLHLSLSIWCTVSPTALITLSLRSLDLNLISLSIPPIIIMWYLSEISHLSRSLLLPLLDNIRRIVPTPRVYRFSGTVIMSSSSCRLVGQQNNIGIVNFRSTPYHWYPLLLKFWKNKKWSPRNRRAPLPWVLDLTWLDLRCPPGARGIPTTKTDRKKRSRETDQKVWKRVRYQQQGIV